MPQTYQNDNLFAVVHNRVCETLQYLLCLLCRRHMCRLENGHLEYFLNLVAGSSTGTIKPWRGAVCGQRGRRPRGAGLVLRGNDFCEAANGFCVFVQCLQYMLEQNGLEALGVWLCCKMSLSNKANARETTHKRANGIAAYVTRAIQSDFVVHGSDRLCDCFVPNRQIFERFLLPAKRYTGST